MYRYFTTQRPPMIGCVPNGMKEVVDYGKRKFVDSIGREAWGYVLYGEKLTEQQVSDYELTEDPNNGFGANVVDYKVLHRAKMWAQDIIEGWSYGVGGDEDDLVEFCHKNGIRCEVRDNSDMIIVDGEIFTL